MVERKEKKIVYVTKNISTATGVLLNEAGLLGVNLDSIEGWSSTVYYTEQGINKELKQGEVEKKTKFQIVKALISNPPEVVLIHQFYGGIFQLILQLILKLIGVRMIIYMDTGPQRFHGEKGLKRILLNLLFFLEASLADRLYAQFRYIGKIVTDALPLSGDNFFFIPRPYYPYPPERSQKIETAEKSPYLLAVSSWWQDMKNLHGAMEVFAEVAREKEDLKYKIVGRFHKGKFKVYDGETLDFTGEYQTGGEYRNKINNLVERLEVKDRVEFLGVKTGEDLERLFRQAKVYFLPVKFHGFSRALKESMAAGTPIVSSYSPPRDEVIGDGECGFLRNTKEGQKNAILELFENEELYDRMQENCLEKAEKHRWTHLKKKWKNVLEEIS